MQVSAHKVVSIHYTLTDNAGTVLDSSSGREPLIYIQGLGHLIPGMEEGIEGRIIGEKLNLKIIFVYLIYFKFKTMAKRGAK
jgi:FKBP-type peptidyl-prolyl cis-trans isomerase SlyD